MKNTHYFPQIDGLRALAVLSVILFHINPRWLPGGFIGVDIFFVISGFLITRIISTELNEGSFKFKIFYMRRMRRILPALYTVLITTLIVGYLLFLPQDIRALNRSALKTLMFWANYYFAGYYDYFGPAAHELPLLHMWSLAVEEQFYFIVPLGLYALSFMKCMRLRALIILGIILSFLSGEIFLQFNYKTTWAYYSLATRAGQLLMGSLLADQYLKKSRIIYSSFLSDWGGHVGLGIIFGCFYFLSENSSYPGLRAFLPTVGAYLVLLGATVEKPRNNWLLENSVCRKIGQMSYSLYLWHWPILAYMRYVYGEKNLPFKWIAIASFLIFSFSLLSWRFIERPFRYKKWSFKKTFLLFFVFPSFFVLMITLFSKYLGLTKNNLPPELTSYGGSELCHGVIHKSCTRGDLTKKPKALLIGDSHAAHLNYFFDELGKKYGFSIDVVTGSSCSPIFGYDENVLPEAAREPCRIVKRYIEDNYKKYDVILIGSNWTYHLGLSDLDEVDLNYLTKLKKMLKRLTREKKNAMLISQVPLLKTHIFRGIKFKKLGLSVRVGENLSYEKANEKIKNLSREFENIQWTDISKPVKDSFFFGENPIYMDNQHLNKFGSAQLGKKILL